MYSFRQGPPSLTPIEHGGDSQLIKQKGKTNKKKLHLQEVSKHPENKTSWKQKLFFCQRTVTRRTYQPTVEGSYCSLQSVTRSIQGRSRKIFFFPHLLPTLIRHRKRQDGVLPSLLTVPQRTHVQCGHGEGLILWDELQVHLAVIKHISSSALWAGLLGQVIQSK